MRYILTAAAVIFVIFIIVLTKIQIGIEPLTELYFENHTKLPKYLFLNKTYPFSFSVRNLEYMPMNYTYNISVYYKNKTINLDSSKFSLENNQTITINNSLIFYEHFEKAKVEILVLKDFENPLQRDPNLKNTPLNIHFLVEEITGPKITIIPD